MSRKNLVVEIWGQKGSKQEFFDCFSKGMHRMLQNLGLKGDTMGLGMCVKFGIKQDFGSGDM